MANNRMYLICDVCAAVEETTHDDCVFYLAKYYPATGWYTNKVDEQASQLDSLLNAWLDKHKDGLHTTMNGEFIKLAWGWQIDPMQRAARKFTDALADALHKPVEEPLP